MQNDGSEELELFHSNILQIASLQKQLKLAKGMSSDGYAQANGAFALLKECRSLFEIIMDPQLHEQIQALMEKIDEFYPQPVIERY